MTNNLTTNYEVPSWAGKPPVGMHLDVLKEGKLIQKLMIDDKRCYLFGRNPQLSDFCVDHASCSRVHAALVYHKHLNRAFLTDLGSTHGTYIGNVRLEGNKPTQLPTDASFHFGASTRMYQIRERPQQGGGGRKAMSKTMDELEKSDNQEDGKGLLGLPETETELDNLTEFNTAHNRRITTLGIPDDKLKMPIKKRIIKISFNDEEDVINPEDIDPSVGRFRNMIQTTVIPKKGDNSARPGLLGTSASAKTPSPLKRSYPGSATVHPSATAGLYDGIDSGPSLYSASLSSKLGLSLPNPAPDIEAPETKPQPPQNVPLHFDSTQFTEDDSGIPKKKKYVKEAWPGRKNVPGLLG